MHKIPNKKYFFSILLCLMLFSPHHVLAAGRVFYDGFEDGTANAWWQVDSRNKCQIVQSSGDGGPGPQSGTYQARCNFNGTLVWNDDARYETMGISPSFGDEYFMRVYIRTSPNLTSTGAGGDNTGPKLLRYLGGVYQGYLGQDNVNGNGGNDPADVSYVTETPSGATDWYFGVLQRMSWSKYEMYFNKSTNLHRVWIDDVLIRDTTAVDLSGFDGAVELTSNWSGVEGTRIHDAVNYMFFDEFEIYTNTGSGGSGSMSAGTMTQGVGDTTAPTGVAITVPSNGATVSGNQTVTASCSDNVAVQNVQMLLDGGSLGLPDSSAPYSITWDTTTASNGSHTLSARCTDTSNNQTTSTTINVTVNNTDTTPPVLSNGSPSGTLSYGATGTTLALTTDENATCKYSSSAGVSYASMTNVFSTTGGTSHSKSLSGLTNGGSYTYYVRCMDGSSNPNTSDYPIAFSVSSNAAPVALNECASPPSGAVFCEDFDTGSTNDTQRRAKWDDYDGATDVNFPTSDEGPSETVGNHTAQFRVAAGQSGGADLVKVFSSPYDKLYTRWYIKYEPGFNFAAPLHGGGLALGSRNYLGNSGYKPDGTNFAYFNLQHQDSTPFNKSLYLYSYYPGMYQDCGGPGSCYGDSLPCVYDVGGSYCTTPADRPTGTPPTITAGQWYCVESMIDSGSTGATGQVQIWLDGISLGQFNNKNLRSTTALKIENLWLSLYHHDGTHSTEGMLFDNVVVGTQRIGCSSVSDTAPPAAPTGLVVM